MERAEGRRPEAMRPVRIKAKVNPYAEGSALCCFGRTEVLCTASLEEGTPRWLEGEERGWVTAEYAMLPRSTHTRTSRDHRTKGRAQEISRLIGRSLRAAVDLSALAGYTVKLDCDVMVADGGTRTAGITGGYVALALALAKLGLAPLFPVAAVSCGKVEGQVVLDLCYEEDSNAEVDLNLVLAPGGRLVEVQSTAEQGFFSAGELGRMVALGAEAAEGLFAAQAAAIGAA
ncbi:ribonuclease PH [Desulfocarbo indianensis]|nr:ribonuclease PH [Desulfocarbo indianensis]